MCVTKERKRVNRIEILIADRQPAIFFLPTIFFAAEDSTILPINIPLDAIDPE